MSRSHWIDEFFRKRMERRAFPVNEGEFEEVRALLDTRNAAGAVVRGGGLSKWWLSALIPIAGLLWWALSGEAGDADRIGSQLAEQLPIAAANDTEQHPNGLIGTNAQMNVDTTVDAVETEMTIEQVLTGSAMEQATRSSEPVTDTQAESDVRSLQNKGTPRSGPDDVMNTTDQGSTNTHGSSHAHASKSPRIGAERDQDGTSGSGGVQDGRSEDLPIVGRFDASSIKSDVDGLEGTEHGDGSGAQDAGEGVRAREPNGSAGSLRDETPSDRSTEDVGTDAGNEVVASEGRDVLADRSEAITFLQPRRSLPAAMDAPKPIGRELPVIKWLANGELYFFGAPLTVRTRSSSGDRSGAEAGSLLGLEYRVRAKRFTWSTGIYYGTYTLRADQGATDVKLNYVEVPLLAGYHLGFGRFGLLMQGGMSVDLLFNSSGRYPFEGDRTGAGFPDDAFRTVNYSWSLRPLATYHVNEHLSVSAGPLWKAQLGEVAQKGPLDGGRVSSSGVSFGLSWRLERATF